MVKILIIITNLFSILCFSQLKLEIKELKYENNTNEIPSNFATESMENNYRGHIFEVTFTNTSSKCISLPLDTITYGLTFAEDLNIYFQGENLIENPDQHNLLSVYPFIYQEGRFIDAVTGDDPFFDLKGLKRKFDLDKKRLAEINKWALNQELPKNIDKTYNWYIVNNLILIEPHQSFSYKLFFNPFFKRSSEFSYSSIFFDLKRNEPYEVQFKIFYPKSLANFLSPKQKKKYKNIFSGIVESKKIILDK